MFVSTALSFFTIFVGSSLSSLVSAVPFHHHHFRRCDMSNALLSVPAGQTTLVRPSTPPTSIGLGLGTQNYTCSPTTSTYTSAGAMAEILDISCIHTMPQFSTIQNAIYSTWLAAPASVTPSTIFGHQNVPAFNLGPHYFIPNPTTGVGISPKWDYSQSLGNPNAFVIGAKVGGIPAPNPSDVDWLVLNGVQGNLATQIFRVETKGGKAPTSCVPGSAPITVKYMAQYWLYGAT